MPTYTRTSSLSTEEFIRELEHRAIVKDSDVAAEIAERMGDLVELEEGTNQALADCEDRLHAGAALLQRCLTHLAILGDTELVVEMRAYLDTLPKDRDAHAPGLHRESRARL